MITSKQVLAEIMGNFAAIQTYDEVAITKVNGSWVAIVKEDDNIFTLKHRVNTTTQPITRWWIEEQNGKLVKEVLWSIGDYKNNV